MWTVNNGNCIKSFSTRKQAKRYMRSHVYKIRFAVLTPDNVSLAILGGGDNDLRLIHLG